MGQGAKLRVEIELNPEQAKLLSFLVAREKVSEAEICRILLLNHLKICRDAAQTGVLPSLPKDGVPPPPQPQRRPSPASSAKAKFERFKH